MLHLINSPHVSGHFNSFLHRLMFHGGCFVFVFRVCSGFSCFVVVVFRFLLSSCVSLWQLMSTFSRLAPPWVCLAVSVVSVFNTFWSTLCFWVF